MTYTFTYCSPSSIFDNTNVPTKCNDLGMEFNEHKREKELKDCSQHTEFPKPEKYSALRHASRATGFPAGFCEMFRSLTSTGGVSPVTIRLDEYLYGRRTPR